MTLLCILAHFLVPLLFFTDLTRNPYFTQITLLNLILLLAFLSLILRDGRLPRTALDLPWVLWLSACGASWVWAYFGHVEFFRPSMLSEGLRAFLFLLVNTWVPFYLAARAARQSQAVQEVPVGRWAAFCLAWGLTWALYPGLRAAGGSLSLWGRLFDPFGALLWVAGLAGAVGLARGGALVHFWHLALSVAFLASAYSILQYFGIDWVWPRALNPYGGRAVSTFGNPNFLSSYLVTLLPLAALYYLKAVDVGRRLAYGVLVLMMWASLLASLTRSSWVGGLFGLAVLSCFRPAREAARSNGRWHLALAGLGLLLAVAWPASPGGGSDMSVRTRLSEILLIAASPDPAVPYSPWYQRLLIWSAAAMMGRENPLLGYGWGLFELFYPFFQGALLTSFGLFRTLRTHANNAHNEILEVWSQAGILGLGAFVLMGVAFFVTVRRWLREGSLGGREAPWAVACSAGLAGMLMDNLLNVSLHFAVPAFLFWWQAGCVMGMGREHRPEQKSLEGENRSLSPIFLLSLFFVLWGSWQWVRLWNREVNYFAGFKMARQNQTGLALRYLERAHAWHPREVNTNYELGNAYARAGRWPEAAEAYREALRSNAGYDEIYYNLGLAMGLRLGEPARALDHYRTSLAINPLSHPTYAVLNNHYFQDLVTHADEASEVLVQAVRFFPQDGTFWVNLGYIHALKGRAAEAEAAYFRALGLDPKNLTARVNLANLYASRGERAKALAEFREVLKLDPANPAALQALRGAR